MPLSCGALRARWSQFSHDFVHHLNFIYEGSGAHGANGGESKPPYVKLLFSHHLVDPVDSGRQGVIGAFIRALIAAGHDDDAPYTFGKTVQIELLWKENRSANPENVGVGGVGHMRLPHRVGAWVGAGLRGQDQYLLLISLLCHVAIHLFLAHNEDSIVAVCFNMAEKLVPYLVGPDRNIALSR